MTYGRNVVNGCATFQSYHTYEDWDGPVLFFDVDGEGMVTKIRGIINSGWGLGEGGVGWHLDSMFEMGGVTR